MTTKATIDTVKYNVSSLKAIERQTLTVRLIEQIIGWHHGKKRFKIIGDTVCWLDEHDVYMSKVENYKPFKYSSVMQKVLDILVHKGHVVKQRDKGAEGYEVVILYKIDGKMNKYIGRNTNAMEACKQALERLVVAETKKK